MSKTNITTLIAMMIIATEQSNAGTFSDSLTGGLNPTYWTSNATVTSTYAVNPMAAGVELSKSATTSGNQLVYISLNMSAVGGNISGDFTEQISFANAVVGPNLDQVQLDDSFADGALFYDVYDTSAGLNTHVFNGSARTAFSTSLTGGTFTISRTGSILAGYFNGTEMFSETESSALNYIDFRLETQGSSNPDSTSVLFNNFSLTASSVPEPSTGALLLFALGGFLAVRRRSALGR